MSHFADGCRSTLFFFILNDSRALLQKGPGMIRFIRNAVVVMVLAVSTSLVAAAPAQAYFPAPPVGSMIDVTFWTNSGHTTEVGRWLYGICDGTYTDELWGQRTKYYSWREYPCL
ncbi:hypothetical protein [Solwaraspora sp. WMMD792]|uniref:hypothetical protein n=1 Tax=Solwaraspora sp. WMMD792 TaxID=3016099 RepID=UPI00241667C6|nr:hypothetical protein [Solwaraspora sp. WMMD792]MDG4771581.1 hypothetical protein [Solwaraspora sp. WMMD792]